MTLELVFWGCLIGGVIFTLLTLLLGDLLAGIMDGLMEFGFPIFQPITLVGAITVFGGTGLILDQVTLLTPTYLLIWAIIAAILSFFLLYAFYVRPMKNAENSTGFRLADLKGKTGEVTVTIPARGFGEVMILTSAGNTNQIAASAEQVEIPRGSSIIVVEIKEHILYVARKES
ncbi:NfeD family protein [Lihuaxuella thermophila]|uniref:NfeD-like C-terminal, partner-binding n=1 Tax=Lihuaxuella thermophila TaxID=1173111 RepID=A0A1H8G3H0_9BACL|nr:NfeD family protein [Lihuaxuella thermophila]SEN38631.1 NfeD-like C-terminal, partner-binding [Lihuaxuella thermophila]